ncbi:unnamed protein product [Pipistrellus nathusii]|uniref:Uncharacterized protein n=1 Tax=Pipistrellus nathusii TaxID=59473 RepID=A0ABP0A3L0_PIPNA
MAACFIDFLILVSENLTGFPDKIVAFDLEGLILMKCPFTLTTFMEKALFLNKIIFHYHDELTSGSYFNCLLLYFSSRRFVLRNLTVAQLSFTLSTSENDTPKAFLAFADGSL